jgi:hypothetical protein
MNKIFCVSCGFKILYEVTKPKFCPSCGNSLGSVSSAAKKEEGEEVSDLDIDLNKLKRDIIVENDKRKTKIEDIWGSVTSSEANSPQDGFSRPESKDPSGKELLDKTIRDCSSSRMKDIDGE